MAVAVEEGMSYGSSNGSRWSNAVSPVEEIPAACVMVANSMPRVRIAESDCQSRMKPADGGSNATGGPAMTVHTSHSDSEVGMCAYWIGRP